MSVGSRKFAEGIRRAVVDHTLFFNTAEQDELKTLLRNFALYTAVNLKAEVHTVELLRINLDEMWSDKFPIGIPANVECCFVLVVLHIDSKKMCDLSWQTISQYSTDIGCQLVLRRQQSRLC